MLDVDKEYGVDGSSVEVVDSSGMLSESWKKEKV